MPQPEQSREQAHVLPSHYSLSATGAMTLFSASERDRMDALIVKHTHTHQGSETVQGTHPKNLKENK